jgi:hypothetical protein
VPAGTDIVPPDAYGKGPEFERRKLMSLMKMAASGVGLAACALIWMPAEAVAQTGKPTRTDVRYGFCFGVSGSLIYSRDQAKSVAECSQRCIDDPKCAAFEIWDHNFTCKLYSAIPRSVPQPQTVFPQNRKQDGTQAQAALGIKVVEGF